ncbi:NodT family efflux transporter outer membrane factor (OMF) lipoprotein [Sphingomonas sp. F9_3S_D5_B_2]
MIRKTLGLFSLAALSACTTVGPNYHAPAPIAPGQPAFVGSASPAFTTQEPPGRWWSLFRDPVLDRLVQQALSANTDLRVAAANLAEAQAALRETRAARLPTTSISGSATYGRASGQSLGQSGAGPTGTTFDAGIDVGYQLDLFGRIRRATEASRADVGAVQAALDVARITVAAETTRSYSDACNAGRQIQVAEQSLRVQQQTFDLTRRLFEGGRATALETGQAGAQLELTRSTIPTLRTQQRSAVYRLAVLTGRPPAEFPPEALTCVVTPTLQQQIPVGSVAALLARRPDIRQSERQLAAATARIGVATADLYPDISLGASVGSTATSLGGLARGSGLRFGLGPLISWTFPNTAAARARIAQAQASTQAALARFDGTWLGALRETETALAAYSNDLERVATLERARANSGEAARIARLRYEAGRENFQIVLDAERSLSETETSLAQARGQLSDDLVSLFLALGGGWQDGPPVAQVDLSRAAAPR